MLDPNFVVTWIKPNEKSFWFNKLKQLVQEFDDTECLYDITNKIFKKDKKTQENWMISYDDESFTQTNLEYDVMLKLFLKLRNSRLTRDKEISYIDPLIWWSENQDKFKTMTKLAKKIFSVPASSGSIERFFSKTGYIMRQHRRQLSDKNAENLFF
ncbi:unnamed protein product [Brachionus calyciflorus]|uniref:HAT C-terminal dimerisation domain-containing protein n=1 Tax=Brachionus calyciflorus TaxID=104777 RepID=A0A814JLT4_9BILA|nr:unnamed protein product [Brachionus calyciflorus]